MAACWRLAGDLAHLGFDRQAAKPRRPAAAALGSARPRRAQIGRKPTTLEAPAATCVSGRGLGDERMRCQNRRSRSEADDFKPLAEGPMQSRAVDRVGDRGAAAPATASARRCCANTVGTIRTVFAASTSSLLTRTSDFASSPSDGVRIVIGGQRSTSGHRRASRKPGSNNGHDRNSGKRRRPVVPAIAPRQSRALRSISRSARSKLDFHVVPRRSLTPRTIAVTIG